MAQLGKNPPVMQETWVRSLGWEDPLEKGKATHSSIPAWRIPWAVYVHGVAKSRTRLATFTSLKGKESEKEYISISESFCCEPETNATLTAK